MADRIKSLGFKHSTLGGMTVFGRRRGDPPSKKEEILEEADEKVRDI